MKMALLLRILLALSLSLLVVAQGEESSPGVVPVFGEETAVPEGEEGTAAPPEAGGEEGLGSEEPVFTAAPVVEVVDEPKEATLAPEPPKCDFKVEPARLARMTILKIIMDNQDLVLFRHSLEAIGAAELLDDNSQKLTIIAPVSRAVKAEPLWMKYLDHSNDWAMNLRHTVHNHIITGHNLTAHQLEQGTHVSLEDRLYGDLDHDMIENAVIHCSIKASNGYLHIVDQIMRPKFFDSSLSELEVLPEFGPDRDVMDRVSLVNVVDFLDARDDLDRDLPRGMTHVGCRIRAFNRINDYLKQTINNAEIQSVKWGELLNETFKNESHYHFMEYNMIERMYSVDDMEHGYEELIMSSNYCAHMWVTKHQEKICFNNACLVIAPPAFAPIGAPISRRIQFANNGYAAIDVEQ